MSNLKQLHENIYLLRAYTSRLSCGLERTVAGATEKPRFAYRLAIERSIAHVNGGGYRLSDNKLEK